MPGPSRIKRRESPLKRVNPSGEIVWVARYTNSAGQRRSAGTFPRKREAADAIEEAYGQPDRFDTFGAYAATWIERHPRSERTNRSASSPRLNAVLDIEIEGRPLRDWPYPDLRRRHMNVVIDHLLRVQGRAARGVIGIRNTLSAMTEDAITDEVAEVNFAKGAKVRASDPRIRKAPKRSRIWTFDQLREFAAAGRAEVRAQTRKPEPHGLTGETLYYSAVNYEPMIAVFALSNLRVGEVFALRRSQLDLEAAMLYPTGNAYNGVITDGDTREKKHIREVPLAPSLVVLLAALPPRIDTSLLFPTPKGTVWHDSTFRRDVWKPAQIASGMDVTPHECRHSYVTNLRAAGIDPADLAQVTGHDIETATRVYTQPLGRSMDAIRDVIG